MSTVLAAGNLTDVHGHQHGTVEITTYTRGVKRLDYVFVTPQMVEHILRSGYESFHARIASDHRGYYVDFDLAGFLDRQLPSMFSASTRAIRRVPSQTDFSERVEEVRDSPNSLRIEWKIIPSS
jgi:hypothetical protein